MEGLGVGWCDKLDFDLIGIFAIECIVVLATSIGILFFIQGRESGRSHPLCYFINVRPRLCMERKMIQAHPLSMVAGANVLCRCLNKAQVGFARHVAHSLRPALRLVVSDAREKWSPKHERAFQVCDVQLDVMKHGGKASVTDARMVLSSRLGKPCELTLGVLCDA